MIQDQDYLWKLEENDFWHKNKDRILIKLIKKGNILDIGAGTGSFSIKMAKLSNNVTYIDASEKYFNIARSRSLKENVFNIDFINDFFPSKKLVSKKFDTIVISGFIEHIKDDVKLLRDIYKLLKPKGRLVLLTSAYPRLYSAFDKSVGHYRRYSRKDLRNKIESVGFSIKFFKNWDILGIPVLLITKFSNKVPLSDDGFINNKFLNFVLDKWFILFENHMIIPLGLDLIVMAEK